jgi:hypothetical protein
MDHEMVILNGDLNVSQKASTICGKGWRAVPYRPTTRERSVQHPSRRARLLTWSWSTSERDAYESRFPPPLFRRSTNYIRSDL